MGNLWFCVVAAMIAVYVVLDGYDLGAGMAQLLLCKTEEDRRQVLESIHPLWDGNEVWLIAGGTTLFFAFPRLYAVSFSGFYLPLMIVLWLLIFRGLAIEFRNQIDSPAWRPLWDFIFGWASAALTLFFGAALGNVVRGVPFDSSGHFFLPLWTNFRLQGEIGILDWYTASIGVGAVLTLLLHGTLWIALRTEGALEKRSRQFVKRLWPFVFAVSAWITFLSFKVQPQLAASFGARPWGAIFPILGLSGLIGTLLWNYARSIKKAFLCSCLFIVGLLTSAAFGLFPYVLPSTTAPELGMTIENSVAPAAGLQIGIYW
ncbi:MAG: cytochrome d ubiquinol oxidase subunit II, partial [Bdellovibrionota bacterium]